MRHKQHDFAPYWEKAFIEGLKKERTSQGMSQAELAEKMSDLGYRFDQATVYKIENGKRKVTAAEAWGLAAVLDVEVEYLYDYQAAHNTPEARAKLIATQADKLMQEIISLNEIARRMAETHRVLAQTIRMETENGLQYEHPRDGIKPIAEYYAPLVSLSLHDEILRKLRSEVWVGDFPQLAGEVSGIILFEPLGAGDEDA